MAEIEVTREHRLAVWRDCHAGYEPHEDSVVGRWVAGLPVSVDMAEHDRVAQAIAVAELRGRRAAQEAALQSIADCMFSTRGARLPNADIAKNLVVLAERLSVALAGCAITKTKQPTEGQT